MDLDASFYEREFDEDWLKGIFEWLDDNIFRGLDWVESAIIRRKLLLEFFHTTYHIFLISYLSLTI